MVWRFSVFFSQKYHFHVSGLGECAKYLTLFDISAFVALLDVAWLLIYKTPIRKGYLIKFHKKAGNYDIALMVQTTN